LPEIKEGESTGEVIIREDSGDGEDAIRGVPLMGRAADDFLVFFGVVVGEPASDAPSILPRFLGEGGMALMQVNPNG
jgi:hypothetical protein